MRSWLCVLVLSVGVAWLMLALLHVCQTLRVAGSCYGLLHV